MARRRPRKSRSLAAQTVELGLAVPQVIAHRLARMDGKEFRRMGTEKVAAFSEAWTAMAFETMRSLWFPWSPRRSRRAALRILTKGVAPVRRRAVANAKRLASRQRRLNATRKR